MCKLQRQNVSGRNHNIFEKSFTHVSASQFLMPFQGTCCSWQDMKECFMAVGSFFYVHANICPMEHLINDMTEWFWKDFRCCSHQHQADDIFSILSKLRGAGKKGSVGILSWPWSCLPSYGTQQGPCWEDTSTKSNNFKNAALKWITIPWGVAPSHTLVCNMLSEGVQLSKLLLWYTVSCFWFNRIPNAYRGKLMCAIHMYWLCYFQGWFVPPEVHFYLAIHFIEFSRAYSKHVCIGL